ncbi:MAG: heavy-metal-associated domain-containing protein [Candidatus Peregrinibacteria bacterium]
MTTNVSIPGIHCAACAALIQDVSQDFPDIQSVNVDLEKKTVAITHNDAFVLASWSAAIEELDPKYTVKTLA